MTWQQLCVPTTERTAETISDTLTELGAVSVTFLDAGDYPIYEPELDETPLWEETVVVGLFEAQTDFMPILAVLQPFLTPMQHQACRLETLPDRQWERAWMENFHPMVFGQRVWICPSWCEPPEPEAINILLDPGLAFGTGTHPTTALCLTWLDANPPEAMHVIDYGCGSGILSIAAMKLGARKVLAVDHDPQAIDATRENANRNHIQENLSVMPPEDLPAEKTDLLIANIVAGPLHDLAPHFAEKIKTGGKLVLSGLLTSQVDTLKKRYHDDFSLEIYDTREDWVCLVGVRKKIK